MPSGEETGYTPEQSAYEPLVARLVAQEWSGKVSKAVNREEIRDDIAKVGVYEYALRETALFTTPSAAGDPGRQLHLDPGSLKQYHDINSLFGDAGMEKVTPGQTKLKRGYDGLARFQSVILDKFIEVIMEFMAGKEAQ